MASYGAPFFVTLEVGYHAGFYLELHIARYFRLEFADILILES